MAEGKKVTYRAKTETHCPVCEFAFNKEELLSGGGRMNAGELTDELHRVYLATQKYGEVYPLLYPVSVCPQCWYSSFPSHFEELDFEVAKRLRDRVGDRKNAVKPLFPQLDFYEDRGLEEGVASYFLAAMCYDLRGPSVAPTFLRGLSFLRAGWLARDLHALRPTENFDYLAAIFLRKASFFYGEVLRLESEGSESMESVGNHGPDIDKNYGFDGVLYLTGVLLLKYGPRENADKRIHSLKQARSAVSRIVGMGQSSRAKPSALLDLGRELHRTIKKELEALDSEA